MNTILAVCMAALFSWWIWSLKQELARTHGHASGGEPAEPAPAHPHAHPVHAHAAVPVKTTHAPARPNYQESQKRRNSGGVAVWTIG